ncbi:MAG: glycerate kinase [Alphaproteobacteria bacterium]
MSKPCDAVRDDPAAFLKNIFHAGLAAADPLKTVPLHLPAKPVGRVFVVGAGKAAGSMALAVENAWPDVALSGIVVTQYGYGKPTQKIEVIEASHPIPDDSGERACRRIFQMLEGLTADDLVLCLLSGGGSALLSLPAPCLSSVEKRAINRALIHSGAPIHKINCVRKHLSAIKGGQLARAAFPASVLSLIISDVPGDDPYVVASGPTLPDPTTQAQALDVIDSYHIDVSPAVRAWLADPAHETPKLDDPRLKNVQAKVISCNADMLAAAAAFARQQGIEPIMLGDDVEGEAREVGREHGLMALRCFDRAPCVLISGGETTVTVRGKGKGGRNSEYLLGAVLATGGAERVWGLACGTDGIDGNGGNAGASFSPTTLVQAAKQRIDPQLCLANNDTYSFFQATGELVVTGPTYTNVNDFRALLVL